MVEQILNLNKLMRKNGLPTEIWVRKKRFRRSTVGYAFYSTDNVYHGYLSRKELNCLPMFGVEVSTYHEAVSYIVNEIKKLHQEYQS